jgi:WD40 repeat protein
MPLYDFFISHSSRNLKYVASIELMLLELGFSVYSSSDDKRNKEPIAQELNDALTASKYFIAIVSKAYLESNWCKKEFFGWVKNSIQRGTPNPFIVKVNKVDIGILGDSYEFTDAINRNVKVTTAALRATLNSKGIGVKIQVKVKGRPRLKQDGRPLRVRNGELFCVAFSPNNRWIAAGSDGKVWLWDQEKLNAKPEKLSGPKSYVYSIDFSNDGRFLVAGSEEGKIWLWDLSKDRPLLFWGKRSSARHTAAVYSVAFSKDSKFIASGGYDGVLNVWEVQNNGERYRKLDVTGARPKISSVVWSATEPDSIAFGSLDNSVRLWSIRSNAVNGLSMHQSSVEAVAFSPDGTLVASCGLDKKIHVHSLVDSSQSWTRESHQYLVRSLAFSPDGTMLASVGWDKELRLWNPITREILLEWPTATQEPWHTDWIWSVAFSPSGNKIATCGSDGQILLWSIERLTD